MSGENAQIDSRQLLASPTWKVLIVDDEKEVHDVTRLALSRFTFLDKPVEFSSAYSAAEAMEALRHNPGIAAILLDVVMEEHDSGLKLVRWIREELGNHRVRIILRTGQAGHAPEESVVPEFDIFAYKDKTELTRLKLSTTLTCATRSFHELLHIESRRLELSEKEAVNEARGVFLANMSHELRTPLSIMMGFAELLQMGENLPATEVLWVESILEHGHILGGMITNVLDMSRLDAGFVDVRNESADLHFILRNTFNRVRPLARGLNFELRLEENIPRFVLMDERKLDQVLVNLLSNAIKYTDEGSVALRARSVDAAGKTKVAVRFEVEDTGIGIPEDDLEHIFDSFVRASNRGAREGTGLGLAIARTFVEVMGGELSVASTPGKGSVFSFTLLMELDEASQGPRNIAARTILGFAAKNEKPRVLIADPGPRNAMLMKDQLRHAGCEVRLANESNQALADADEWRPHLLLMDARMSTIAAHEIIGEIRRREKENSRDAMKIAGLAHPAFQEQMQLMEEAGCDALIHRPVSGEELLTTVGRLLELKFTYKGT